MDTVPYEKPRLSRQDWITAAQAAIARGGLAAVAVEPLARDLGVTKGSFYAHFPNRDALIEATLDAWASSHAAGISDPALPARERLRAILETAVTFSRSGAPSPHVGLLADVQDPRVQAALQRVSKARIAGLARCYRELGHPPARARSRARLAYATYLGLLELAREGDLGSARPLVREAAEMLIG